MNEEFNVFSNLISKMLLKNIEKTSPQYNVVNVCVCVCVAANMPVLIVIIIAVLHQNDVQAAFKGHSEHIN